MVEKLGLTIEETDKLTGSATGKPNTGTFRLADLIGNDTTQKVKNGLRDNLPNDEAKALFAMETILERVVEKGLYGDKMGKGFYQKTKERDATGRSVVLSLDLNSLEYRPFKKPEIGSLGPLKTMETLAERYKHLYKAKDKGGDFVRATTQALFAYVSNRIPEIADDLYKIDDALRAGFAWDIGPFEVWDMLGLVKRLEETEAAGFKVAAWVHEMVAAGHTSFYKVEGGNRLYYDRESKAYKVIPGTEELIVLDYLRDNKVVWKNSGASLFDIGDGVLNLEFQTKMNAIGSEVLQGVNKAIEIAEKEGWKGLVIGNNAVNFSAGANLAMILMLGIEQEFDEIDMAVRMFQQTNMRVRYSGIPVVVAPHGLTLGGGCEISLHADVVVAATETYMGLVEVGVGLLPAGGGTKELTVRMSDAYETGDVELNSLLNHFMTIGQAKVATSAHEAFDLNLMRRGDVITVNTSRQLGDAKAEVLRLHAEGYIQPTPRNDIRALGQTGLGLAYSGVYSMFAAGYISEHDLKIAKKIAWVMCGGDLSGTQLVSEQYLLDLEREAFLSLMGEKLTLERIQHMLKTGKPLRN